MTSDGTGKLRLGEFKERLGARPIRMVLREQDTDVVRNHMQAIREANRNRIGEPHPNTMGSRQCVVP